MVITWWIVKHATKKYDYYNESNIKRYGFTSDGVKVLEKAASICSLVITVFNSPYLSLWCIKFCFEKFQVHPWRWAIEGDEVGFSSRERERGKERLNTNLTN